MPFLDKLFGPQVRNLGRAMDRTTSRHSLLSENLSNVNVPGYKRRDVDFAIEVETASAEQRRAHRQDLGQVTSDKGSIRIDGNSVDLEKEVVAIAETELRYSMLAEMTGRYFSGLRNVIREGR